MHISRMVKQNGAVEGRALAALNQASLSAAYFGEAVLTIGYLWNLTGTRVLPSRIRFTMLLSHSTRTSHEERTTFL